MIIDDMLKRCLFFVIIGFACSANVQAQNSVEESNLKAVFIYNFTKYIDWDISASDDFVIGVIGSSPVYTYLKDIARTKTVNDKRIVLKHFTNPDDITFCNILFISGNSTFSLSSVLSRTNTGTLTIGEEPGFAEMGAALNFFVDKDKIKFEANVRSLKAAGLKASSQLLKLARIVN